MSKKGQEMKKGAVTFPKRQFLKAANFTRVERDVLAAILEDDKQYTLDEVQKLLKDFKARRVQ
jgi:hypothetical protein